MTTKAKNEMDRVFSEFTKASRALRKVLDWAEDKSFDREISPRLQEVRTTALTESNGDPLRANAVQLMWALKEQLQDLPRVCMGQREGVWSAVDQEGD